MAVAEKPKLAVGLGLRLSGVRPRPRLFSTSLLYRPGRSPLNRADLRWWSMLT